MSERVVRLSDPSRRSCWGKALITSHTGCRTLCACELDQWLTVSQHDKWLSLHTCLSSACILQHSGEAPALAFMQCEGIVAGAAMVEPAMAVISSGLRSLV